MPSGEGKDMRAEPSPLSQTKGDSCMRQPQPMHPPVGASAGVPLVRVEHLTRVIATRAQKTIILDDVTFCVPTYSLFAINGPSGSGKSTLLILFTSIHRPTSGRV